MPCKNLRLLVTEVSKMSKAAIIALQVRQLLDYYALAYSTGQALGDIHSWNKMAFVELKHEEYCYMKTLPVVGTRSNRLVGN